MSDTSSTAQRPSSFQSLVSVVVLWAVVLFICLLSVPHLAWLIFLVWLPLYLFLKLRQRLLAACLVPLCGAILVAHFNGYRLFGFDNIIDNDPALGGDVVVAFGPGNLVTLADGRSFQLAGLRTIPGISLSRFDLVHRGSPEPTLANPSSNDQPYLWSEVLSRLANGIYINGIHSDYRLVLPSTGLPARVQPIDAEHARVEVVFHYQKNWGCSGPGLMDEQLFPPRVNRYQTFDLATTLLGCHVIEPDDSEDGREYRKWMTTHRSHYQR